MSGGKKGSGGDGYEVGYGKPPRHSRFRPGRSGNPKGRPKGLQNFSTDLQEVLRTQIEVTQGGKTRRLSTQRASFLSLAKRALGGDVRALGLLLSLAQAHNNPDEPTSTSASATADDLTLLNIFRQRVLDGAVDEFEASTIAEAELPGEDDKPSEADMPAKIERVRLTKK